METMTSMRKIGGKTKDIERERERMRKNKLKVERRRMNGGGRSGRIER